MMTLLAAAPPPQEWAYYCGLTPDKQLAWEERGDERNKSMLYLMNSKNKHSKKDLRLAYSQGNMTAYPSNIKEMARYLSTQYPNNKPTNQRNGKKGDKNRGDDPKSKDKNSNTGDTACAHVEDTTTTEESTIPSGGASIIAHVFETNEQSSCPWRTVEEILEAHPMNDDDFSGGTNPSDVFINIMNSKGMMTGSHITDLYTNKYKESFPSELLNTVLNVPQACNFVSKKPVTLIRQIQGLKHVVKNHQYNTCKRY